jgi:hypothetical protein
MSIPTHTEVGSANPQTLLRPAAWFAASLVVALALLGAGAIRPDLQLGATSGVFARTAVYLAMLTGFWLGLRMTDQVHATRLRHWLLVAIPVTLWLAVIYWLALTGAFRQRPAGRLPTPVAIFTPMIIGLPLLLRSRIIGAVLDRMPDWWLVAIQAYRVLGATFLIGWARGDQSSLFALPAGIGDVTVGLLAVPIAYLLAKGGRNTLKLAVGWNLLGLLDFTIAIGIGILTTLQIVVPDRPNVALGIFPAVMIPAFAVPSWTLLHALSLRQLRRKLKVSHA